MKAFLLNQFLMSWIIYANSFSLLFIDIFFKYFIIAIVSEKPTWGVNNEICIVKNHL